MNWLRNAVPRSRAARRRRQTARLAVRLDPQLRVERVETADPDSPAHLLHADGGGWLLSEPLPGKDDLARLAAQAGGGVQARVKPSLSPGCGRYARQPPDVYVSSQR